MNAFNNTETQNKADVCNNDNKVDFCSAVSQPSRVYTTCKFNFVLIKKTLKKINLNWEFPSNI